MFKSNKNYTNRYGDSYYFVRVDDAYQLLGDLKYWRFGNRKGQQGVDFKNLGMCDPSGGPYISVGMEIDGNPITKIYVEENELEDKIDVFFET